jgi:hypothetical protein
MELKFSKSFVPAVCALTAAVLLAGCSTSSSEKKKTIVVQRPAHIEAAVYIREASATAEPETLSGAAYNQKAVVHTLNSEEPLVTETAVTVPLASSAGKYALLPVKSSLELAQELSAQHNSEQAAAHAAKAAPKAKVKKPKAKPAVTAAKPKVKPAKPRVQVQKECKEAAPVCPTIEVRELPEKRAENILERARSLAPETVANAEKTAKQAVSAPAPAPEMSAASEIKAESVPVMEAVTEALKKGE